jgi:hypothetical protein
MKGSKPGVIAILAAIFAIVSIFPAIDAFTVSRTSQVHRVETILMRNHMLASGQIKPNADISGNDKTEITNIMNYMFRMGHASKIDWLPANYNQYQDFSRIFGFEQQYGTVFPEPTGITWYNGTIEQNLPIDITGYATALKLTFYKDTSSTAAFELGGKAYKLNITYTDNNDVEFLITDNFNQKQAAVTLKPLLEKLLTEQKINQGSPIPPADLTMDATGSSLKMRVILQNISFQKENGKGVDDINGEAFILIGEK